jgi:UDP-N-acetylmuramyl pentapeptide phosphotransferase/UDP-N-acetylglucosamine-1-phosphate transferase
VVRRATPAAFGVAVLFAVLYLLVLWWTGGLESTNFVVFWLALGALLAFGTYKIARRVAFDVIRSRAARSPA